MSKSYASTLAFFMLPHDSDKLQSFLSPMAIYIPLFLAVNPVNGAENIRKTLEKQYETYFDCDCEMNLIGSVGYFIFTERSDHVKLHHDRRRVSSRVCPAFELDDNGKITNWREYWVSNNVLDQMDVTRDALDAAMN